MVPTLKNTAVVALGLAASAGTANAQCTREELVSLTDSYLEAQSAGSPDALTPLLAAELDYSENFQAADLAAGILSQPLTLAHNRSTHDTTACAAYTELIVTDPAHPYVIGSQFRLTEGAVTQIETIITDEGDWLFNATGTYYWASQEAWDVIPEEDRDSREVIQAAGDAYADLFNDKSVTVPWGTPCARLEGGAYTGNGSPTDRCDVGVPSGKSVNGECFPAPRPLLHGYAASC